MVCYDISSNKTRREIVKLLSDYGKRVQESVFLCSLSIERIESLEKNLRAFYARKKHAPPNKPKAANTQTQTQTKPKKAKKTPDAQNNTLEILMLNMEKDIVDAALVLGTPIDANRSYTVL